MKRYASRFLLLLFCVASMHVSRAQQQSHYKLPHYEKMRLSNGLTLYLMEKHDVPLISLNCLVPSGAIDDGNKGGLASLTAECLTCGTKSYTKNEIEKQFDFLGASLYTSSSSDNTSLSSTFASKDGEQILPIIKEILVDPMFPADEFAKKKKLTLTGIDQAKESPGSVISDYWNKLFYGNTAYGNVVSGTVTSVTPLTSADARSFYARYYTPDGTVIAVAGDFNAADMKTKLTKLFSEWKKVPPAHANVNTPLPAQNGARVLLVNKDDALETTFYIGGAGLTRNNPDYITARVVNTFFGSKFTSWLNDELRIKSGLTYGAFSRFDFNRQSGTFFISTHTANATTQDAIDKAIEVVNRLHTQTIDEETLTSAKNYLIGQLPPQFQSTRDLAGLMASMFWYGFDESYINNFEANVNGVTVAKANEVIAKYFPKNNLQFVLIGKASLIKPVAEKYGKVTQVEIKDDTGKGF